MISTQETLKYTSMMMIVTEEVEEESTKMSGLHQGYYLAA